MVTVVCGSLAIPKPKLLLCWSNRGSRELTRTCPSTVYQALSDASEKVRCPLLSAIALITVYGPGISSGSLYTSTVRRKQVLVGERTKEMPLMTIFYPTESLCLFLCDLSLCGWISTTF